MKIIATKLLKGMGLGNQLFCYVTTRALAQKYAVDFCILNNDILPEGLFEKLDTGVTISGKELDIYNEKDDRAYLGNSTHDIEHGCYISGVDEQLLVLDKDTCIMGNLQAPEYFKEYKEEIKEWLKVIPEKDSYEYSKENLCIINIRGGEYAGDPALFLRRKYWLDAMKEMRKTRSDMEFMVVTDDLEAAHRILPEVKAYHFDLAGDYCTIKNAHYLILSNSTFAFFPAFTSETVKRIIAPKYWARHNVSDGYWASEQNIYEDFEYMDRHGKLFTAKECKEELKAYKEHSSVYLNINQRLSSIEEKKARSHARWLRKKDMIIRAIRSLKRRLLKQ